MTRVHIARWTCNSCNQSRDTNVDKQPKGWVGYGFTRPDVPAGEKEIIGHLCEDCAHEVNAAMGRG